jgi:hypothetical protein
MGMPRLTDVQYVCDYCGEAFSEPSGAVIGRLSVWRRQDDPREAVSGLRRAANGAVVGRAGPESGVGRGRGADPTRSHINPSARSSNKPKPEDAGPTSWHFPLPSRLEVFDLAVHPECADKLTYGAWLQVSTTD